MISDWVIAIGMVIIAGVCILGITLGFKNIARSGGEKYRDSDIDRNKGILHITHGIKDILVLRRRIILQLNSEMHVKNTENQE